MAWMKRSVLAIVAVGCVGVGCADSDLTSQSDKVSYSLGYQTGKAFTEHQIDVDVAKFTQGMKDAMSGGKAKMSEDDMQKTLSAFQKDEIKKMQDQQTAQADKNQQASDAFLAANAKKDGVKSTDSGLQYKILTPGTGASPKASDTVTVDYEGKLIDGTVFDSSYKRGKPVSFPLSGVIPGWTEGVQLMKEGATWEFYIPADLAYGKAGAPGAIGPNQALIFKIHLISIDKATDNDKTDSSSADSASDK